MNAGLALRTALKESRLHAAVMAEALAELGAVPFSAESAGHLGRDNRRLLDQLAYRYAKLQDTLGERVLPALLASAEEPLPETATFAEKFQRLERLGIIHSAESWRELRELRNQIAHEYVDQPEIRAAILNRFVRGVGELLAAWDRIARHSGQA